MPTIQIEVTLPDFPAGVKMSVDQYSQWLIENMTFQATGGFLTGQIGGATPTSNNGIYINGTTIQLWDGTKYVNTTSETPIGVMMPYPSGLASPPANYLFCDGQLVLKTDYPILSGVLNDLFAASGDDPAYVRLPSTAGRSVVGSGTGDYNPRKTSSIPNGLMVPRAPGDYFGFEWQIPRAGQPAIGAPTARYLYNSVGTTPVNKPFTGANYSSIQNPGIACHWIIRAK